MNNHRVEKKVAYKNFGFFVNLVLAVFFSIRTKLLD
jgi:hypothetical protein